MGAIRLVGILVTRPLQEMEVEDLPDNAEANTPPILPIPPLCSQRGTLSSARERAPVTQRGKGLIVSAHQNTIRKPTRSHSFFFAGTLHIELTKGSHVNEGAILHPLEGLQYIIDRMRPKD
jgi:hypothetical protein